MLRVRVYYAHNQTIIAACDEELLGNRYAEGKVRLHVNDFYDGMQVEEDSFHAILSKATNMNLVGERCVSIAQEMGLVQQEGVIVVEGIPHAMVFYL